MGRQEVAAKIRRKKLISATVVSGDTQRGSERLALCSQDTFHISKTSESLGEGKSLGGQCPSVLFRLLHFSLPWSLPSMQGG